MLPVARLITSWLGWVSRIRGATELDTFCCEACLQDLSQARLRWGAAADGFLTLFTHKIVLPGVADLSTRRQISALAGDIDIPYKSVSRPRKLFAPATVTTHLERRPRLPIDAIARGVPGQALHLVRSSPCRINLHPLPPPPAP